MTEQEIDRLIRECALDIYRGWGGESTPALVGLLAPLRSRLLELERELAEARETIQARDVTIEILERNAFHFAEMVNRK